MGGLVGERVESDQKVPLIFLNSNTVTSKMVDPKYGLRNSLRLLDKSL